MRAKFLWGHEFCRVTELFGSSFCISIIKISVTQILCHSSYFDVFCMIQQSFSIFFKISSKLKSGIPNILRETDTAEQLNLCGLTLLYFNFENGKGGNSTSSIRFPCYFTRLSSVFLWFSKFFQMKEGALISWGEPILQYDWIILFPTSLFQFWKLKVGNSISLIRFQCILHDLELFLLLFQNFLKLKKAKVKWLKFLVPLFLHLNFKNWKYPNFT